MLTLWQASGPTKKAFCKQKQINGLAVLVEQELELSPFSGAVFLFCNRERRILKALTQKATLKSG